MEILEDQGGVQISKGGVKGGHGSEIHEHAQKKGPRTKNRNPERLRKFAFVLRVKAGADNFQQIIDKLCSIPQNEIFLSCAVPGAGAVLRGFVQNKADTTLSLQSWRRKLKLDAGVDFQKDEDYTGKKGYDKAYYKQYGEVVEHGEYRGPGNSTPGASMREQFAQAYNQVRNGEETANAVISECPGLHTKKKVLVERERDQDQAKKRQRVSGAFNERAQQEWEKEVIAKVFDDKVCPAPQRKPSCCLCPGARLLGPAFSRLFFVPGW